MKRWCLIFALVVLSAIVACANEQKPDVIKGEGEWGNGGTAIVRVFDINSHFKHRQSVIGNVRNISGQPIKNIIVTVGRNEKGDTVTTLGTDVFALNLQPDKVWRWSVDTETQKHQGYVLLGVTVDGQVLSQISK